MAKLQVSKLISAALAMLLGAAAVAGLVLAYLFASETTAMQGPRAQLTAGR